MPWNKFQSEESRIIPVISAAWYLPIIIILIRYRISMTIALAHQTRSEIKLFKFRFPLSDIILFLKIGFTSPRLRYNRHFFNVDAHLWDEGDQLRRGAGREGRLLHVRHAFCLVSICAHSQHNLTHFQHEKLFSRPDRLPFSPAQQGTTRPCNKNM